MDFRVTTQKVFVACALPERMKLLVFFHIFPTKRFSLRLSLVEKFFFIFFFISTIQLQLFFLQIIPFISSAVAAVGRPRVAVLMLRRRERDERVCGNASDTHTAAAQLQPVR